MKVRFLTLSQLEVDHAVEWYDGRSAGLGTEFLDDPDMTVRRIVRSPIPAARSRKACAAACFPDFPLTSFTVLTVRPSWPSPLLIYAGSHATGPIGCSPLPVNERHGATIQNQLRGSIPSYQYHSEGQRPDFTLEPSDRRPLSP